MDLRENSEEYLWPLTAVVESFFHTLKNEEVREKKYQSLAEARINLFDYIEVYYNRNRKHSYLEYKSPIQFRENLTA